MILEQLRLGPLDNFVYILGDQTTATGAVIDPGWDIPQILRAADKHGLELKYVFNTHSHPDHIQGNGEMVRRAGSEVVMHKIAPIGKDHGVDEGDVVEVGGLRVRVLYTPGHLTDSVCYLVEGHVFTGDTLFIGECGRTDLPGGSSEQLYDSLMRLATLPEETVVCAGHDYGPMRLATIGEQKATNYTLAPRTKQEFVRFMQEP
jgi:hydroxyacylglutathione hydrolase